MKRLVMLVSFLILITSMPQSSQAIPLPPYHQTGPVIEINLAKQELNYRNGGIARTFHCSTGRAGYRTPKGRFRVYAKERHAVSYKYGNTPMPFTLWFHPAGYGIHASKHVPEYPASHGCVRLEYENAKWLFQQAPIGTPVIIF